VQSNVQRAQHSYEKPRTRRADHLSERAVQLAYFCKSQQCDRFELAETFQDDDRPYPGYAQELGVVVIAPIFEREAAGIYRNSAAIIDADGSLLACIARCTYRTTRCTTRSTTSPLVTGISITTVNSRAMPAGSRFGKRVCDHRRLDLLGPVVPEAHALQR